MPAQRSPAWQHNRFGNSKHRWGATNWPTESGAGSNRLNGSIPIWATGQALVKQYTYLLLLSVPWLLLPSGEMIT